MKKYPINELIRLAMIDAEGWQTELAQANHPGTTERKEAEELAAQYRAYRMRRWGKTRLEAATEKMKPATINELREMYPGDNRQFGKE